MVMLPANYKEQLAWPLKRRPSTWCQGARQSSLTSRKSLGRRQGTQTMLIQRRTAEPSMEILRIGGFIR